MAEFKSSDPRAEVLGDVVKAFLAGFPQDSRSIAQQILEKHGVTATSGTYCPLQNFLNAMREISDKFTGQMLFRIGEQIALHASLPQGIDDLQKCLASIDVAYHLNHKGGDIGGYKYEYLGKSENSHLLDRATLVSNTPYPCAFDHGVIEGFSKRFKPAGTYDVVVRHEDGGTCRRDGQSSCAYLISWF